MKIKPMPIKDSDNVNFIVFIYLFFCDAASYLLQTIIQYLIDKNSNIIDK